MSDWQRDYIAWHIATEHPWDLALHMEALALTVDGMRREIAEAIEPAVAAAAARLARTFSAGFLR
jgi:hypothetical protein